jgi:hypothetical protein
MAAVRVFLQGMAVLVAAVCVLHLCAWKATPIVQGSFSSARLYPSRQNVMTCCKDPGHTVLDRLELGTWPASSIRTSSREGPEARATGAPHDAEKQVLYCYMYIQLSSCRGQCVVPHGVPGSGGVVESMRAVEGWKGLLHTVLCIWCEGRCSTHCDGAGCRGVAMNRAGGGISAQANW